MTSERRDRGRGGRTSLVGVDEPHALDRMALDDHVRRPKEGLLLERHQWSSHQRRRAERCLGRVGRVGIGRVDVELGVEEVGRRRVHAEGAVDVVGHEEILGAQLQRLGHELAHLDRLGRYHGIPCVSVRSRVISSARARSRALTIEVPGTWVSTTLLYRKREASCEISSCGVGLALN